MAASQPSSDPVEGTQAPVACAWCGTTVTEVPLTWSTSMERGRLLHYCDRCSREHLRSLEAKLDADFW